MDFAISHQQDESGLRDGGTFSQLLAFGSVQDILGKASEILEMINVMMSAFTKSLAIADNVDSSTGVSRQFVQLTRFKTRQIWVSAQAIQIWEELLEKIRPKTSDDGYFYAMRQILNTLSRLSYDEAVAAEVIDQDVKGWISKLENITKPNEAGESAEMYQSQENLIRLEFWYHRHGRLDEARACFKPRILDAIDILTDEYPENDAHGFELLSRILHMAGDEVNAAAAISVCMAPLDRLKAARGSSQDVTSQRNTNVTIEANQMSPYSPDEIQE